MKDQAYPIIFLLVCNNRFMTKIHRLRFNEQKERKRDKNGINTSQNLNLHLVHCYLLCCQSVQVICNMG